MSRRAGSITKTRRRPRVEPTPTAERLLRKGTKALEAAFDAVAEDPERALQAGGAFLGRVLDTLENAQRAYREDPEAARREVKEMVVGALAERGRKKRKRAR